MDHTRREFCVHAGQALSLAALGAVVPGCGGGGGSPTAPSNVPQLPSIGASIVNNRITLTVDAGSPLAGLGSAALVQASGRNFLVARTGADAFSALTAICTHEACTVTGFQSQNYVCPCHGSRYGLTGVVLNGPAPSSLAQFQTEFSGNTLTILV
jgi:Rieske Fe-S protein